METSNLKEVRASKTSVNTVKIIELPKINDPRGNLTFLQNDCQLPFKIKRVHWTYDVPGGEIRGGHAFRKMGEVIIALSGSFDVKVDDGTTKKLFSLNRSYYGLYVPNGLWHSMENFSTNSLALTIADRAYDELDYIYDYEQFKGWKNV